MQRQQQPQDQHDGGDDDDDDDDDSDETLNESRYGGTIREDEDNEWIEDSADKEQWENIAKKLN